MSRSAKLLVYVLSASLALLFAASNPVFASQDGHIKGGWYPWKPYQYLDKSSDLRQLTGLDVQLFREVFEEEMGLSLDLPQLNWDYHQQSNRVFDFPLPHDYIFVRKKI